jgi:chemotaxis protein CheD
MTIVAVGIGECQVSHDGHHELVAYALGSCIALAVWDPVARVGGLLHYLLPESADAGGSLRPYRYADTGIPLLLRKAYRLGADRKRLLACAAGGAAVAAGGGLFDIGKRNCAALHKTLERAGVMLQAEETGGSVSRNVRLEIASGRVVVSGGGIKARELTAGPPAAIGARGRIPEAPFAGLK